MSNRIKVLHRDDRKVAMQFIDYARLGKKENVSLEILARHLARHLKVNPDQSNKRLANRFAALFESHKIA